MDQNMEHRTNHTSKRKSVFYEEEILYPAKIPPSVLFSGKKCKISDISLNNIQYQPLLYFEFKYDKSQFSDDIKSKISDFIKIGKEIINRCHNHNIISSLHIEDLSMIPQDTIDYLIANNDDSCFNKKKFKFPLLPSHVLYCDDILYILPLSIAIRCKLPKHTISKSYVKLNFVFFNNTTIFIHYTSQRDT